MRDFKPRAAGDQLPLSDSVLKAHESAYDVSRGLPHVFGYAQHVSGDARPLDSAPSHHGLSPAPYMGEVRSHVSAKAYGSSIPQTPAQHVPNTATAYMLTSVNSTAANHVHQ